jgi:uncharacterized protein (UPF0332 family)
VRRGVFVAQASAEVPVTARQVAKRSVLVWLMSATSDVFLGKARKSLAGAASELTDGRYNNAANRRYYACFQAALAARERAGIRPPGGSGTRGHAFVQAQFVGQLINRRKVYPPGLRDALAQTALLRELADYKITPVSHVQATRAVGRARALVTAVAAQGGTSA